MADYDALTKDRTEIYRFSARGKIYEFLVGGGAENEG